MKKDPTNSSSVLDSNYFVKDLNRKTDPGRDPEQNFNELVRTEFYLTTKMRQLNPKEEIIERETDQNAQN